MAIASRQPTFLESLSVSPHVTQARVSGLGGRSGKASVDALASTMSPYSQYGNSSARTREQVQHFTYWNYVGINIKSRQASSHFPMISYSGEAAKTTMEGQTIGQRSYSLTSQSMQWIRQAYGYCQSVDADLKPVPESHPFYSLLCDPNPDDTWNEFSYEHFLFLELTGTAYWWVVKNGLGLPSQLAVVPSHWVTPDYNRDGSVKQYNVTPLGSSYRLLELLPEEVLVSRKKSPLNKRDGYSSLSAASMWSDAVESIEDARRNSFANGGNPDLLIQLGEKYSDPTSEIIDRIKEKFMRRYSGTRRYGEPQVIPPGIEIEKWSHAPKEMDFAATGDQARDNNLALHGTPKVLAGVTTDVNRATVEGANVVFCQTQINPMLRHLAGTLTYLGKSFDERIKVWFEDVTPHNQEQELREDLADFQMGAVTPNERRAKRGRKPISDPMYDSAFLAAGLQPLSQAIIEGREEAANEAMEAAKEEEEDQDQQDDEDDEADEGTEGSEDVKDSKQSHSADSSYVARIFG